MLQWVLWTDSIHVSAAKLFLAYVDYKKHPCLQNHSALMDCLDEFVGNFESLEELMNADIVDSLA